jgi:hypothetical protein
MKNWSNYDVWYNREYSKKQKFEILYEKLIYLEQNMKKMMEMKKQILQFEEEVVDNR